MIIGSIGTRESAPLRLSAQFRPALRTHFGRLDAEDLYLRFGTHSRPEILDGYVDGIDFGADVVLGVFDDELDIAGAAHVSSTDGQWELGLSVLPDRRNRGIGTALLRRAMQSARNAGADRLCVHCLSVNQAMTRLVTKVGAAVVPGAGEADGAIALPAATALAPWGELAVQQLAACAYGLTAQRLMARRMGAYLFAQAPGPRAPLPAHGGDG